MCFSAPASFIAGGGLAAIGAGSVKVSSRHDRIVALMPFLFGIQQLFEGWQWLALSAGTTNPVAAYGFLFFALMVWPVYSPLAFLYWDPKRKTISRFLLGLGVCISLFFFVLLLKEAPVVDVVGRSIRYDYHFSFPHIGAFMYVLVVCGSPLASSVRAYRIFGMLLLASAIFSGLFSAATFTSVWCFLAAILSGYIFVHLKRNRIHEKIGA